MTTRTFLYSVPVVRTSHVQGNVWDLPTPTTPNITFHQPRPIPMCLSAIKGFHLLSVDVDRHFTAEQKHLVSSELQYNEKGLFPF